MNAWLRVWVYLIRIRSRWDPFYPAIPQAVGFLTRSLNRNIRMQPVTSKSSAVILCHDLVQSRFPRLVSLLAQAPVQHMQR